MLFLLSVLSTLPFFAINYRIFSKNFLEFLIVLCLLIQVLVHAKIFLHLDFSLEQRWKVVSAVFSIIVGVIILSGSIWIMKNLNHNLCVM